MASWIDGVVDGDDGDDDLVMTMMMMMIDATLSVWSRWRHVRRWRRQTAGVRSVLTARPTDVTRSTAPCRQVRAPRPPRRRRRPEPPVRCSLTTATTTGWSLKYTNKQTNIHSFICSQWQAGMGSRQFCRGRGRGRGREVDRGRGEARQQCP